MPAPDGDERSRLKTDTEYLLLRVLQEFKARDKYQRGLITAASFSNVLEDFGLQYGQPEVAKLLEYCIIKGDGFVIYKDLVRKFSPSTPRAKQSETEKFLLKANDLALKADMGKPPAPPMPDLHNEEAMQEFLAAQTEEIRRLYSRWDRGMLTDHAFVHALSDDLKIPLTEEFRHALAVHGPARDLSFAKLIKALRIDNFLHKGGEPRKHHHSQSHQHPHALFTTGDVLASKGIDMRPRSSGGPQVDYRESLERSGQTGRQAPLGEIRRNPVTWDPISRQGAYHPSGTSPASPSESSAPIGLRRAICLYCDGKVGSWVFRQKLKENGILVTMEIDRLIRLHEADNSVRVAEFLAVVQRQIGGDDRHSPAATPAVGSGAQASYSARGHQGPALLAPFATEYAGGARRGVDSPKVAKNDIVAWTSPSRGSTANAAKLAKHANPNAKATRTAGDIIAWRNDLPPAETKTQPVTHQAETMDVISWQHSGGPQEIRPSKRALQAPGSSGTYYTAPFGTEADRGKAPQECGTQEYLPSSRRVGLR
ncbi:unnamed protein product [Amoebophrya sp. A25]|nr:unnamed protein product [Amoebophrya sp. A25]|eukprot:GSA25T00021185001.1